MAKASNYPNVQRANDYATGVLSGKIAANKWIRLACENYKNDLRKSRKKDFEYKFCNDTAERVCKFIQMMPHTKGEWARKGLRLTLEPWQCFFIINVFGWLEKQTGLRRYRKAELYVPRKNGKSALAAGIGLYMLAADNEHGAEVYSGATTEKQAFEVFKPAQIMAKKLDDIRSYFGIEVFASNISIEENGSKFEPIVGNPPDGASPSCAIVDEYHEHKDDRLFDTMITGMGAREQPLMLMITTAGDNLAGACYQNQIDSQKVLEGVIEDNQRFALIYGIDKDDDPFDIENVKKANPNFGVSIKADFLKARMQDAKNSARKLSTYLTKHLNVWVGARDAYFNVGKWNKCIDESLKLEDFAGQDCYLGLDLASRVDIAALEILFPLGANDFVRFGKYYLPESAIENGQNEHYQGWHNDGFLTITDGEIIDFNYIKDDILEICSMFNVLELGFDPFQATMLITELMNEGVPVVELRPTVLNFSEPMKALDGMIRANQIRHNGDPVQTWMISNVVAKADKKDNVYPNKARPENKIDGVVALLMALNRSLNGAEQNISAFLDNPITAEF